MSDERQIVIPTHGEMSVSSIVPAILTNQANSLVSESILGADCVVLLVLDGLGWNQFKDHQDNLRFLGTHPPAITRAEFQTTGFTQAHLRNGQFRGWWSPATLMTEIIDQVETGVPFVYAYYDGVDKIAHVHGLGKHYQDELRFVDALAERIVHELPEEAVLIVTADHGMVEVGDRILQLDEEIVRRTSMTSGEARFLWLHADNESPESVMDAAQIYADAAWIVSREQMLDEQWFGAYVSNEARRRMGDVAIVARDPVAILDPRLPDSPHLVARHGSLTADEMLVPFLSFSK